MTRGEWAVHFDTDKGYGEIEYLDNRPNEALTQQGFDAHYAWLVTEHERYQKHQAEVQAKAEALANEQQALVDAGNGGNAAAGA
ncbi:hypothetical protein [Vibrio sp. SCSIO 43137]|uniref:hypothetical protein n=1 Tax=Vibrio sp. SCSIO 43137 TaxID=3021011 RepID=UPI0023070C00|nr:hypothetical protein [Vibrio sp. SCSIO 43137]WCE31113.1 hypothetical protein PK654_07565 [Vibrio sp. SCSIO 43137]